MSSPQSASNIEDDAEIRKDSRSTVKEIMKCVQPVLFVENLFGIFRFNVTEIGFEPVTSHKKYFGILYSTVIAILFMYSMELFDIFSGTVGIRSVVEGLPSIVFLIQFIAAIISTLFFVGGDTIKIFSNLVELDEGLKININTNFYSSTRNRIITLLLLLIVTHVVLTFVDIVTDEPFQLGKPLLTIFYFEQDLEMFFFCVMLIMLRSRLQVINDYLRKFVYEKDRLKTPIFVLNDNETSETQFNFIGRISSSNMRIRDLASMYDTIATSCHLLNEVFKFQIFMNLVSTFIFVVLTIWMSLFLFRYPEKSIYMVMMLATSLMWCLLTIISVAIISFSCERLLSVRNIMKLLVNEIIMDYDLPKNMRVQAKIFMELIEAWPLRFLVYDMFSIDIKLMLKFVSVATTYLIVIIQISHLL